MQYLERFAAAATGTPAGGSPWEWNPLNPTGAQIINAISLCEAQGAFSIAAGWLSVASGAQATAIGALCIASGENSIALGNAGQSAGNSSFAFSGNANNLGAVAFNGTVSGDYGFCAGTNCLVSANNGVAIGFYCISSGQYSTALGYQTEANQPRSTTIGGDSKSYWWGAFAHAQGKNTDTGDRQNVVLNWSKTTTDSTPTTMALDGGTREMDIFEGFYGLLEIDIIAAWESGISGSFLDYLFAKEVVSIYFPVGGSLTISNQFVIYTDNPGPFSYTLGISSNNFVINIIGKVYENVQWQATGKLTMLKVQ